MHLGKTQASKRKTHRFPSLALKQSEYSKKRLNVIVSNDSNVILYGSRDIVLVSQTKTLNNDIR